MRATLVFPPSLCLPNTLYYALPVLAGALKRAGHSARLIDLNLVAADRLLSTPRTLDLVARAREHVTRAAAAAGGVSGRALRLQFDRILPDVLAGPECKDDLRDRERFLQPAVFKRAFWTVVDALAFWYQLDPIFSPHSPTFLADLIDRQRREPWSPLTELYEEEMTDLVCAGPRPGRDLRRVPRAGRGGGAPRPQSEGPAPRVPRLSRRAAHHAVPRDMDRARRAVRVDRLVLRRRWRARDRRARFGPRGSRRGAGCSSRTRAFRRPLRSPSRAPCRKKGSTRAGARG